MRRSRRAPRLEVLEDRAVPALTLSHLTNGSVYLSGTPRGELDVIRQVSGPSTFKITDNGANLGTYNIQGSLSVSLASRPRDVKIDLNNGYLPGNLLISLGNGFTGSGGNSVDIYDENGPGATGKIGGTVTILKGNGKETINVGVFRDPGTGKLATDPVTIAGNLTVATSPSNGSSGDSLTLGAGSTVRGSVTATLVDTIALGSATTGDPLTRIGGGVSISNYGALHSLQAVVTAAIGGSLTATGTVLDDSFALQNITTPGSGSVGGSLTVNLADGLGNGDQITLGANTTVGFNASLAAGGNFNTVTGDQFDVLGSVFGSLTVNMGNGMNTLVFTPQNPGDPDPFVGGDMVVNGGNGTNNIGVGTAGNPFGNPFGGTVDGNLFITLGNGDNGTALTPMVLAPSLGGLLIWRSGNGMNFVQLGNFGTDGVSRSYTVNMLFGNDDDSVSVDVGDPGGTLNGKIDEGGRTLANAFNLISGTLVPTFHLYNVP